MVNKILTYKIVLITINKIISNKNNLAKKNNSNNINNLDKIQNNITTLIGIIVHIKKNKICYKVYNNTVNKFKIIIRIIYQMNIAITKLLKERQLKIPIFFLVN